MACVGNNAIYEMKNTDSEILNMTNHTPFKKILLAVEHAILVSYYYRTAKVKTLYESIDGPADHPPNVDSLGDFYRTIPELSVEVC